VEEIPLTQAPLDKLGKIHSVAWKAPDGSVLIGGSGTLARWDRSAKAGELVPLDFSGLELDERTKTVAGLRVIVSPQARHVVVWNMTALAIFDSQTGQQRALLKPDVRHFTHRYFFSQDDERLLIEYQGFGEIGRLEGLRLFDLNAGKEVADYVHGAFQTGIGFAPQTGQIVTAGKLRHSNAADNVSMVTSRDVTTGEFEQFPLPEGHDNVIGTTRDGRRMLSVRNDPGTIFVWDLPTRKIIRQFDMQVALMSVSFDGWTVLATEPYSNRRHAFRFHTVNR
jgi:hypothetical protein